MYPEDVTKAFTFMNQSRISTSSEGVKLTQIFKSGHGLGTVLLDITDRIETLPKILQRIAQQYPSRNGILIRQDKDITFLEINFGVKNPDLDAILNKGVIFDDKSVVIPCIALDSKVNTVYVRLYNLLLLAEDKLTGVLKSSLHIYGNLLDVEILLEPTTNTYMGSGYVIVDTECRSTKQLTHKMKHANSEREFYAM